MRVIFSSLALAVAWLWIAPAEAQKTPLFRDYLSGPIYYGHHAEPDLSSRDAYNFRTRLRAAAREEVNFASHYRVVTWGCGTSCVSGAVVDLASGHVTFFPFSICCSAKVTESDFQPVLYRPNSSLIVFVGLRNEEQPDASHFYEFTRGQFRHIASYVPPNATPRADCLVELDGRQLINSECSFSSTRDGGVQLQTVGTDAWVDLGPAGALARVKSLNNKTSDVEQIGKMQKSGACWQNYRARICAWKIGEARYFMEPAPVPIRAQQEATPAPLPELVQNQRCRSIVSGPDRLACYDGKSALPLPTTNMPIPTQQTATNNIDRELTQCYLTNINNGNYTSRDGGASALHLMQICADNVVEWVSLCTSNGKTMEDCNLGAGILAQAALMTANK